MIEKAIQQRKKADRRAWRYALLSALLILVMVVSTGCAALLTGDNRKAYDLMVKAAEYFKYPSSVQIVSGEVTEDSMFCVIRAKNSFGNYRSDSYFVSSSGYPSDYYSSYCYSNKLNYDMINNALAAHFGVASSGSSGNIFSNLLGGIKMSSGGVIVLYIVILIVVLCLHGYLASNASDMANEKGYEKRKWFHICFWLGPIGFIIVASMPDLVIRKNQNQTNELLGKLLEAYNTTAEKQAQNRKDDVSSYLPEL